VRFARPSREGKPSTAEFPFLTFHRSLRLWSPVHRETVDPVCPHDAAHGVGMTSLSAEGIHLHSPAAICCAIPYLLGFHPSASAVLVWLQDSRIVLTQRIDLPAPEIAATLWAKAAGAHPVAGTTEAVIAVLFPQDDIPPDHVRLRELAHAIVDEGWSERIDVIRAHSDAWSDLLCDDPACCLPEGEPIDPCVRDAIAAEFAGRGLSPMESRDAIVTSLGPHADLVKQVTSTGLLMGDRGVGRTGEEREAWRDDMVVAVLAWARDRSASPEPLRMATLLLALRDTRVRDTVLWELARLRPRKVVVAADQFARLLRAAPGEDVAAVATCACVSYWLVGDGTRAGIALDRALDADPNYRMAQILDNALHLGCPPSQWRDAMRSLRREECRRPGEPEDAST